MEESQNREKNNSTGGWARGILAAICPSEGAVAVHAVVHLKDSS